MARVKKAAKKNAPLPFEEQIWNVACVLWGHIPAADYRKVIIGLIFKRRNFAWYSAVASANALALA